MPEPTPRQLVLCGLALLGLVVLAVVYAARDEGVAAAPRGGPSLEVRGADAGTALVVHVAGAAPAPGVPLDLNTATVEQLDELDGIGPATAQQIVAYREAHGGFGSVEELDQVPGIGETRLAALRDKVRV